MQWHDIDQNSEEWLDLRVGKLTGSNLSKVMANYGKPFGDPAKRLAVTIAMEQVTGRRSLNEGYSNSQMERGHIQEPIARRQYEDQTFCEVTNGGFFDCGRLGCSPDGLVYDDGLIEIKSVLGPVHYANIKRGGLDPAYKWQVYFNLMTSERDWIDFISYCADFPEQTQLYIHRVYSDECKEQFDMLRVREYQFFDMVEEMKKVIRG